MRILWLDHPARVRRYDTWLHTDFALELKKHVDALYFYAPEMQEKLPEHTPIAFDKDLSMKGVVEALKIDVIIMDTRGACYYNYFPKTIYPLRDEGECWLPKDFHNINKLKICIEEDYQYEYSDKWYQDLGVSVLLQKHYSQSIRKMHLPVRFFPFSVDTDIFKPTGERRVNKIGFAGTILDGIYIYRMKAIYELEKHGYMNTQKVEGEPYVRYLTEYVSHLSCGSRYSLTPAKTFEIMASGSVLLTNRFMGIEEVLDNGSYVDYKNDVSDIREKAEKILNDKDFVKETLIKAQSCIQRRHSHHVRIKELLDIINEYYH